MNENESSKKTKALTNPNKTLVSKGIDDIFKRVNIQSLLVERLLKEHAVEELNKTGNTKEALQKFELWRRDYGIIGSLSLEAQRTLFLLKNKYKIEASLKNHTASSAALEEMIHHIIDTLFDAFQKAQNTPVGIRQKKGAGLQKQKNQKPNLLGNISLN